MWLTVDGERCLRGAESRLLCRAVASMLSELVADIEVDPEAHDFGRDYGIDWFDQWDPEQRMWLLEQVTTALLTERVTLRPAAMWEATVDVIFQHVFEAVGQEIDQGMADDSSPRIEDGSWKQDVILVLQQQRCRAICVGEVEDEKTQWRRLVMQISDRILGFAAYHVIESYRDEQASKVAVYLQQKGLPPDFLEQMPPVLGLAETHRLAQRLRTLLEQFGRKG